MSPAKTVSISALSSFIMATIILWSCGPSTTPSPSSEWCHEACAEKVPAASRDGGVK